MTRITETVISEWGDPCHPKRTEGKTLHLNHSSHNKDKVEVVIRQGGELQAEVEVKVEDLKAIVATIYSAKWS